MHGAVAPEAVTEQATPAPAEVTPEQEGLSIPDICIDPFILDDIVIPDSPIAIFNAPILIPLPAYR